MERILQELPSFALLAVIAFALKFYFKRFDKRFEKQLKSIRWQIENKTKVSWFYSTPRTLLYAPTCEELLYRVPLLILFSELSVFAWIGIVISSFAFGLEHYKGTKITFSEILLARSFRRIEIDDDLKVSSNELSRKLGWRLISARKWSHVLFATVWGLLLGYLAVKFQSIWICVFAHFLANFAGPVMYAIAESIWILICSFTLWPLQQHIIWPIQKKRRIKKERAEMDARLLKLYGSNSQQS